MMTVALTSTASTSERIAPTTTVGAVQLTVADLERSTTYYTQAIGLSVLGRGDARVSLGAGTEELLELVEEPAARPVQNHTGLFHFALLVPDRADLARWLVHASRTRVPISGASDHFVSEAIYLSDPDGHGIEIYRDRPRANWEGQVERMSTLPLDANDLVAVLGDGREERFERLPAGTRMGHIHLQVRDVEEAVRFYRDLVGFDLMTQYGGDAAFLGAGGYHHHVGANVWNSRGATPAPLGVARMTRASIVLPDVAERDRVAERLEAGGADLDDAPGGRLVRDPSGIELLLTSARA